MFDLLQAEGGKELMDSAGERRSTIDMPAGGGQLRGSRPMAAETVAATSKRINNRAPKNKKSKTHNNSLKSGDARKLDQGLLTKKPDLLTGRATGTKERDQDPGLNKE